ncbi:MAG: hypothetical protein A2539_09755 [Elusimicrobia bacterium RIFOXYD2_FULL_34_15]|nr:MAG: hypothetical protein A2539_09755 [Elusimicrobia bacterium RIFOXYD2_FULL_34_15]
MDFRLDIVDKRFRDIKRTIIVSGGKGGIGKSLTSSFLAVILSDLGYKVGLLDLDLCGPSDHLILGLKNAKPIEDKGIIPPEINGIKFMSIVLYTYNKASVFRKEDYSNAVVELLSITLWDKIDFLIIDSPPGIENVFLDSIRLIKNPEFIILTTQSAIVIETVKKLLDILNELNIPILGIIENMKSSESNWVKEQLKEYNIPFLGEIPVDSGIENSLGNITELRKTEFYGRLKNITLDLLGSDLENRKGMPERKVYQ